MPSMNIGTTTEFISTYTPLAGQILMFILFAIVALHAITLVYHWLRFGTSTLMNLFGIAVYLGGLFILLSIIYGMYLNI